MPISQRSYSNPSIHPGVSLGAAAIMKPPPPPQRGKLNSSSSSVCALGSRILKGFAGTVAPIATLLAILCVVAWMNGSFRTPGPPRTTAEFGKLYSKGQSSRFGKLDVWFTCPATNPKHEPTMLFEPSTVGHYSPLAAGERDSQEVDLLVGILSACQAPGRRKAVRDSWMRLNSAKWGTWRAVFIVGSCKDELAEEQRLYGDLLFTEVPESYHAIYAKVLSFFDYAASAKAKFAMKTDDDTFVFVDRLLQELKRMDPECLYWGTKPHGFPATIEGYDRSDLSIPTTKWFLHPDHFTQHFKGVKFMAGGGYILSSDIAKEVVENSNRDVDIMAGLPEDANTGRLVSKESYSKCHCGDSRFIASAGDLQGRILFTTDGSPSDFNGCEVSDFTHRSITIHGIHHAPHMAEILSYATSPLQPCEPWEKPRIIHGGRPWMMLEESDSYRTMRTGRVWQRARLNRGRPIQLRPLPITLAMANLPDPQIENGTMPKLKTTTFNQLRDIMNNKDKKNKDAGAPPLLPYSSAWSRLSDLTNDISWPLPWCTRLQWAHQASEQFAMLEDLGIMACDLSLEGLFVNASSLDLELSAGQSWVNLPLGGARFHTMECPHGNAQCEACYLYREEPMEWLPEAQCSPDTKRCLGFDSVSQTKAIARRILKPLLLDHPLGFQHVDYEVSEILSAVFNTPFPLPLSAEAPSMSRIAASLEEILSSNRNRVANCLSLDNDIVAAAVASNDFESSIERFQKEELPEWMDKGPYYRMQISSRRSHDPESTEGHNSSSSLPSASPEAARPRGRHQQTPPGAAMEEEHRHRDDLVNGSSDRGLSRPLASHRRSRMRYRAAIRLGDKAQEREAQ